MRSIQKNVIPAILTMIRNREEAHGVNDRGQISPSVPLRSVRLREALFSDFRAVIDLKKRWGLIPESLENWNRFWTENPALAGKQFARPIGWVLEAEGQVVGYLGNISLAYRYGERKLVAVTGSGLVVEPAYRSLSMSLVAAFYRQSDVDLYLTTTAVGAVGRIARAFKSVPLPQADYDSALFWVLRPYRFSGTVMKRLGVTPLLGSVGKMLGAAGIATDKTLRRRSPRGSGWLAVSEIPLSDIGEEFQALWTDKLEEGVRLLAERSPASLRWHFDIPGHRGNVRVLCCRDNGVLLGYAVVRSDPESSNGLRRSLLADMLVRRDDPSVIRSLLIAAYDCAKQANSDVFEVLGFPPNIRELCYEWKPYVRKYPACPFFYKAADRSLHHALCDGSAWYASPFDGDTTLMP